MKRVELHRKGCVWDKTELNSVFEFQLKFPFLESVSCQRLAWLKALV